MLYAEVAHARGEIICAIMPLICWSRGARSQSCHTQKILHVMTNYIQENMSFKS